MNLYWYLNHLHPLMWIFKRFWCLKWFWQNFCHKKSTPLLHSYLKHALEFHWNCAFAVESANFDQIRNFLFNLPLFFPGVKGSDEAVGSELVISISAIFIILLILIVVVFIIRFKRARDATRNKCTAPNNTKMNGDTTMTIPGTANGNGNPFGTIQRCGSSMRRPINNGFSTLEQHPHNTLR